MISAFPIRASTPIALPPPPMPPSETTLDYYNFPATAAFLRHARGLNFGLGLGYATGQDGLTSAAHLDRYVSTRLALYRYIMRELCARYLILNAHHTI